MLLSPGSGESATHDGDSFVGQSLEAPAPAP